MILLGFLIGILVGAGVMYFLHDKLKAIIEK